MGVFRAVGLGIGIIVLKLLLPDVMSGLEGTLVAFFGVTQLILAHVGVALGG